MSSLSSIGKNRLHSSFKYTQPQEVKKMVWTPQKGLQQLVWDSKADIVICGGAAGSGKTSILLMNAVRHIQVPGYNAIFFRRSDKEINSTGGLKEESQGLYPYLGGRLVSSPSVKWKFNIPSTQRENIIEMTHLQYEDTVLNYQGISICNLNFDELTHFTKDMFFYLASRNRSVCGVKPTIRATCNPDPDSWVKHFIKWWIDDNGDVIKERRGVIRYYFRNAEAKSEKDEFLWGDTKEECYKYIPIELQEKLKKQGFDLKHLIKSVTFIYGTIEENQKLLEKNPNYLGNLLSQSPENVARLYYGNWNVKKITGDVFDMDWFTVVDKIPELEDPNILRKTTRFWDMASTAKELATKQSYYTANLRMTRLGDDYYIEDVQWRQIKIGDTLSWMKKVALIDGTGVNIRWEKEGGSAASFVEDSFTKELKKDNQAYNIEAIKPLGDKVTRASSPASSAKAGHIYLVRGDWNTQFFNAIQSFDGSRKPLTNDIVDCLSGAYADLVGAISYDFDNMFTSENKGQSTFYSKQKTSHHHRFSGNKLYRR